MPKLGFMQLGCWWTDSSDGEECHTHHGHPEIWAPIFLFLPFSAVGLFLVITVHGCSSSNLEPYDPAKMRALKNVEALKFVKCEPWFNYNDFNCKTELRNWMRDRWWSPFLDVHIIYITLLFNTFAGWCEWEKEGLVGLHFCWSFLWTECWIAFTSWKMENVYAMNANAACLSLWHCTWRHFVRFRATVDGGWASNILGTSLRQTESLNWTLLHINFFCFW
jgi:hypothetical protein